MQHPEPFFRESGAGPAVVCLHSNASSSSQWRALIDLLSPTHHVFASDGWSAGKSPSWTLERPITLRDEVALLDVIFSRIDGPAIFVGHSYGAAVALIAALERPGLVRALAVYEPTLFSLVDAESPPPNDADGIRDTVTDAGAALDAGDADRAAERFIDFWMGSGAWAAMPDARKAPIATSVTQVRRWGDALFGEPTPLPAFAELRVPVLYMTGKRSPPSSLAVARLLTRTLPMVGVEEFEGLGHMGPVTHPAVVNAAIGRFVASNS